MSDIKECDINISGCSCCGNNNNIGIGIDIDIEHGHGGDISKTKLCIFIAGAVLYVFALLLPVGIIKFILFISAYTLLGGDVVLRAIKNMLKGQIFDENFLMSVSTIGALIIGEYPEAIAVMLFYQIGEYLQDRAADKSRKSIRSLMNIKADYANVIENGIEIRKNPKDVPVGSIILIKPGEKIPLDGVVIEGTSQADLSALTGESLPVEITAGISVLSGSLNISGVITIHTTKDYKNSTVAKILEMIENASNRKAPTERFITKFARVYTPAVVLAAVTLAVIPPLVTGQPFSDWIYRSLVFLFVSCPCALVISVPLSFFSGIGAASSKGVLFKGGNVIQSLAEANTIVFDKTGTLTKGVFDVIEIVPANGANERTLLETAFYAEQFSNHPIAKAIVKKAKDENIEGFEKHGEYEEKGGYGIIADCNGKIILAGNERLISENNLQALAYNGVGSIVHIAKDGQYMGFIVIADTIRKGVKKAIESLIENGISNIVMLTGDRKETAEKIAAEIGIYQICSELLPDGKVNEIERIYLENSNAKIVFVGDGINDAPVLARSDVGIAMGGIGSDAAVEAADVVLMNDEPAKITTAIRIARSTMKIVKQNIALSLIVKFAVLGLAMLGYASMLAAVFADVGVTLLVVLNSVRKKG